MGWVMFWVFILLGFIGGCWVFIFCCGGWKFCCIWSGGMGVYCLWGMLGFVIGECGWLGIIMGGCMGGLFVKFGEFIGIWFWNLGFFCFIDWWCIWGIGCWCGCGGDIVGCDGEDFKGVCVGVLLVKREWILSFFFCIGLIGLLRELVFWVFIILGLEFLLVLIELNDFIVFVRWLLVVEGVVGDEDNVVLGEFIVLNVMLFVLSKG